MIEIPLTKGFVAIVDDEDADLLNFNWHASSNNPINSYGLRNTYPYGRRGKRERIYIHKVVFERMIGRSLNALEICDHIDNNAFNNTRKNLRLATPLQNGRNKRKSALNTSGFKGVHFRADCDRWVASIRIDRKQVTLGYFTTPEAAYAAYCEAAITHYGEFARVA